MRKAVPIGVSRPQRRLRLGWEVLYYDRCKAEDANMTAKKSAKKAAKKKAVKKPAKKKTTKKGGYPGPSVRGRR